jgi:large subunit ribosomal protein L17
MANRAPRQPLRRFGERSPSRQDATLIDKLMTTLAERYAMRSGGYIRIIKAGFRYGDNAAMVVIEFVDRDPRSQGQRSRPDRD